MKKRRTIDDAISELHRFLESDVWYACHAEWKTEKDMWKYFDAHFNVLRNEIRQIRRKKP